MIRKCLIQRVRGLEPLMILCYPPSGYSLAFQNSRNLGASGFLLKPDKKSTTSSLSPPLAPSFLFLLLAAAAPCSSSSHGEADIDRGVEPQRQVPCGEHQVHARHPLDQAPHRQRLPPRGALCLLFCFIFVAVA